MLGRTTSERNLSSLFIMNSAGEEDEEQPEVDYGGDSGEESSMSFNRQARSTIWRRMLCSRCIPADLLPGFGLAVNIEILRVTNERVLSPRQVLVRALRLGLRVRLGVGPQAS